MKKTLLYTTIAFTLSNIMISCGKNFLDVNTNPNQPTQASAVSVMTNALQETASIVSTNYVDMNGPQNYYGSASFAATPGPIATNNFTSNNYANTWTNNYHAINDYTYVLKAASQNSQPFLIAIAKTMMALHYQMLVDTYNDVPYTEAIQLDGSNNLTPKYDKAQDIYIGCIKQLDTASLMFQNASLMLQYNPQAADVMFKGNASSWARFANTLRLRMLLHMVNVTSQQPFVNNEMQKLSNDPGGFLQKGQSALVNPGYATDAQNHLNPLWAAIGYKLNGNSAGYPAVANAYFISKLDGYNDPRIGYFYGTNIKGQIVGSPLGGQGSNPLSSSFGGTKNLLNTYNPLPFNDTLPAKVTAPTTFGLLQSPTMSSIVLSSWESLFLQAEAVQRNMIPGNAQDLYQQAITDNFVYLNVTFGPGNYYNASPTNYATMYYSQNIANVGWTSSGSDLLGAILIQKYIALCFTAPLESWTDYRRTGYPKDIPFTNNIQKIYNYPFRFVYPQSEYNTNAANVGSEGTVTAVSPKIFWMQ